MRNISSPPVHHGSPRSLTARRGAAAFLAVAALTATPRGALAQYLGKAGGVTPVPTEAAGRFQFAIENDAFVRNGTDQLYTNGLFLHSQWRTTTFHRPMTRFVRNTLPGWRHISSYLGLGITHEIHTPQTLAPCHDLGLERGCDYESDGPESWYVQYAPEDRPFSALASMFVSGQSYWRMRNPHRPLNWLQWGDALVLTGSLGVGEFGRDAFLGGLIQENWHRLYNEQNGTDVSVPVGWEKPVEGIRNHILMQVGAGVDWKALRLGAIPKCTQPQRCDGYVRSHPVGFDLDLLGRSRFGHPRNELGMGAIARFGLLPRSGLPGEWPNDWPQPAEAFAHASILGTAVITDYTYGPDFDRYRHFKEDIAVGWGARIGGARAILAWHHERILFKDPLRSPRLVNGELATSPIDQTYHRYLNLSIELLYR